GQQAMPGRDSAGAQRHSRQPERPGQNHGEPGGFDRRPTGDRETGGQSPDKERRRGCFDLAVQYVAVAEQPSLREVDPLVVVGRENLDAGALPKNKERQEQDEKESPQTVAAHERYY